MKIYNAFKVYGLSLFEIAKTKLPALFMKAKDIPQEADDVKESAKSEFEELDPMKKAKALFACAFNMKSITKIPEFIKSIFDSIK